MLAFSYNFKMRQMDEFYFTVQFLASIKEKNFIYSRNEMKYNHWLGGCENYNELIFREFFSVFYSNNL